MAKGQNMKRYPVLLGKFKPPATAVDKTPKEREIYASVTSIAIEKLKLTKVENAKSLNKKFEVRGSKGAGSIKVAISADATTKLPNYYSIPVPGWFKIEDMRKVVKALFKTNTPSNFIAPSGRSYSV